MNNRKMEPGLTAVEIISIILIGLILVAMATTAVIVVMRMFL